MHLHRPAAFQLGQHHVQPGVQIEALPKALVQAVQIGHTGGPVAEFGFGDLAPFQQFKFQQHFGAIAGVALGVLGKAVEFAARQGQGRGQLGENRAVAGNDGGGVQAFDQVQRLRHLVKRVHAFQLWEHHTKTVLPQGIGRHQQAVFGRKQNDRMRVVPGGGVHLPVHVAPAVGAAGLQQSVEAKCGAVLSGVFVAQLILRPVLHRLGEPGGNPGEQVGVVRLQRMVAAAVVAVQVGVDQQVERAALQGVLHQRQGLRLVFHITAVDQGGAVSALQQHVVGR